MTPTAQALTDTASAAAGSMPVWLSYLLYPLTFIVGLLTGKKATPAAGAALLNDAVALAPAAAAITAATGNPAAAALITAAANATQAVVNSHTNLVQAVAAGAPAATLAVLATQHQGTMAQATAATAALTQALSTTPAA